VSEPAGDRGLVAEETDAAASEKRRKPVCEHVEAGANGRHGLL